VPRMGHTEEQIVFALWQAASVFTIVDTYRKLEIAETSLQQ